MEQQIYSLMQSLLRNQKTHVMMLSAAASVDQTIAFIQLFVATAAASGPEVLPYKLYKLSKYSLGTYAVE